MNRSVSEHCRPQVLRQVVTQSLRLHSPPVYRLVYNKAHVVYSVVCVDNVNRCVHGIALLSLQFQALKIHPLIRVLFTFPLRYLYDIRLTDRIQSQKKLISQFMLHYQRTLLDQQIHVPAPLRRIGLSPPMALSKTVFMFQCGLWHWEAWLRIYITHMSVPKNRFRSD